jgi:UDP-N-acetylmuramoyl-L-alanyl-D-glutamate--2,6-diaminopimelate ligase
VSARLSDVAERIPGAVLHGTDVVVVDAVVSDTEARPDTLFCAVPGRRHDGHDHARAAVAAGAVALLVERTLDVDVPQLVVPSVRRALGPAAAAVHGDPADELCLIGVTGTNGKTTVTFLIEAAMAACGWGSGRIGTLGASLHGRGEPGSRTTPEATDLQRTLRSMRTRGADGVVMEVSSHGLDLHRVDGMLFDVAAFTNLGRDHLDWHGTMERYLAAKARLFTPGLARRGVVLVDAPGARDLDALAAVPMLRVGAADGVDIRILETSVERDGSSARISVEGRTLEVRTVLRGPYNLDNVLVAVAAAICAGMDPDVVVGGVAEALPPPGRLEPFGGGAEPLVLVDYAHTPDAVSGAIGVGRGLLDGGGRLIVVLGAGGDRDQEKRGPMGSATDGADLVVVTDDNARGEDPALIRAAVLAGARTTTASVEEIADRARAVEHAVLAAAPTDVVLILGRGHETHQEQAGRFVPLDDRELVRSALTLRHRPDARSTRAREEAGR